MWYSFKTNELGAPYVQLCKVQDGESYFPTIDEAYQYFVSNLWNSFNRKVKQAEELLNQHKAKEALPLFVYFVSNGKLIKRHCDFSGVRISGDMCHFKIDGISAANPISLATPAEDLAKAGYYETPDAALAAHTARLKSEFDHGSAEDDC